MRSYHGVCIKLSNAPKDTYILILGLVEMLPYVSKGALQMNLGSEGNGTPLEYSCLENPMDRGAW